MESMRHSSLVAEPSGVPSSKKPRRYQSPSQASRSSEACSARGVRAPCCGADRLLARVGERREGGERGVQEPAEPDALALPQFADAVHAVVPVAGADQRQAVGAERQALIERAGAMLEQSGGLVGDRRAGRSCRARPAPAVGPPGREPSRPERRHRRSRRHSGRRRRRATRGRRRCACARPGRNAAATNAGRRLRRTAAPPRAAGARASSPDARSRAPCRPAADRGSRRRRSPDRSRSAPRRGRRASGRAASRSA